MKVYILMEELSKSLPVCDCTTYETVPVIVARSTQTIVEYIHTHYQLHSYDIRDFEDFMCCTEVFTKSGERCVSLSVEIMELL